MHTDNQGCPRTARVIILYNKKPLSAAWQRMDKPGKTGKKRVKASVGKECPYPPLPRKREQIPCCLQINRYILKANSKQMPKLSKFFLALSTKKNYICIRNRKANHTFPDRCCPLPLPETDGGICNHCLSDSHNFCINPHKPIYIYN